MNRIVRTMKVDLNENKLVEINLLYSKLKFTLEVKQNKRLSFLDMCIEHSNNSLSSTWCCKPTDTGLLLNFHALTPKRFKRSVVQGFVFRIWRACSSGKRLHESLTKAKEISNETNSPMVFITSLSLQQLKRL